MNQYSTIQRRKLLEFFKENSHCSFSVKQIFADIGSSDISISSIYRNISALESEGLIQRVHSSNKRDAFYQYFDPSACAGIIHLICEKCAKAYHLDCKISNLLENESIDSLGFVINMQKTVIYGLCKSCA